MTAIEIMNGRPESDGYKVDVSRGGHNGRVSSEWFSRPDDEKYLSLSELYTSVKARAARSKTRTVESSAIRVEAHREDPEKLALVLPDAEAPVAPTHWSFGQLASLVGAPAAYLRQLPAPLAGINLQYGLTNYRAEQVKTMEVANGRMELRAVKPLSDRLVCDLTVHRTMALRNALANNPQLAMLACLHTMVLQLFYHYGQDSCIEITPKSMQFGAQAEGLADMLYVQSIDLGVETRAGNLPKEPEDLWDVLTGWDSDSRDALFAHCVAMTVNAVQKPHYRKPRQIVHANALAATLGLDMAKAGWTPTARSYLGRVTKAQILAAVREAKGDKDADRIAGFKKPDMVEAAEELLAGTGWLPEPLRTPPLTKQPDEPELEIVDESLSAHGHESELGEHQVALEAAE